MPPVTKVILYRQKMLQLYSMIGKIAKLITVCLLCLGLIYVVVYLAS